MSDLFRRIEKAEKELALDSPGLQLPIEDPDTGEHMIIKGCRTLADFLLDD